MKREMFCKWVHWMLQRVKVRKGKEHPVWVGPVLFLSMWNMSDKKHMSGDMAPESEQAQQARKSIAEFYQTR